MTRETQVASSTPHLRLNSFKLRGVLNGAGYLIDPVKVGVESYIYLLDLNHTDQTVRDKVSDFARKHQNAEGT